MTFVAKYNLYKAVSTVLTVGTPIISLASCSQLFIHRSDTSISAAGVFALLFAVLFFKDKLLENLKMPSPFVISVVGLIFIVMIESILYPIKIVFATTVMTTAVDAVTFRRMYKDMERKFTDDVLEFKRFGFIFAKNDTIFGGDK